MQITDVKVTIAPENEERLKAFATVTFDGCFIIRDLKLIEGTSGLFVAMPSRKLTDHCPKCGAKNHLRARFCNECGGRLDERRGGGGAANKTRTKLHADIAHPINAECRKMIQDAVIKAYEEELARSGETRGRPSAEAEAAPEPEEEAEHEPEDETFGEGIL